MPPLVAGPVAFLLPNMQQCATRKGYANGYRRRSIFLLTVPLHFGFSIAASSSVTTSIPVREKERESERERTRERENEREKEVSMCLELYVSFNTTFGLDASKRNSPTLPRKHWPLSTHCSPLMSATVSWERKTPSVFLMQGQLGDSNEPVPVPKRRPTTRSEIASLWCFSPWRRVCWLSLIVLKPSP